MKDFFKQAWNRPLNNSFLASIGTFYIVYLILKICLHLIVFLLGFAVLPPPKVTVIIDELEVAEKLQGMPKFDTTRLIGEQKKVFLWDPSTLDYFGEISAMDAAEVKVRNSDGSLMFSYGHKDAMS